MSGTESGREMGCRYDSCIAVLGRRPSTGVLVWEKDVR